MRVGVIIVGEYREFKIAVNSWNFRDNSNIEYWISTWEESDMNGVKEVITEKDFTDYLPLNKFHTPKIKNLSIHPKEKIYISDNGNVDTSQAFRYNWMFIYETILASKIKYDLLMITRPDLWYENKDTFLTDNFIKNLKKETIYVLPPKTKGFVNDLLFYGEQDVIMDFMSKAQYQPVEHYNLGKIIDENYNIEFHDGLVEIVRPSARNLNNSNYSITQFQILNRLWTEERDKNFNNQNN